VCVAGVPEYTWPFIVLNVMERISMDFEARTSGLDLVVGYALCSLAAFAGVEAGGV
jgi:hypothetical protein